MCECVPRCGRPKQTRCLSAPTDSAANPHAVVACRARPQPLRGALLFFALDVAYLAPIYFDGASLVPAIVFSSAALLGGVLAAKQAYVECKFQRAVKASLEEVSVKGTMLL